MINEENKDNLDKYLKVFKYNSEVNKAKPTNDRLFFNKINIMSQNKSFVKKTTIRE